LHQQRRRCRRPTTAAAAATVTATATALALAGALGPRGRTWPERVAVQVLPQGIVKIIATILILT